MGASVPSAPKTPTAEALADASGTGENHFVDAASDAAVGLGASVDWIKRNEVATTAGTEVTGR